MVQKKSKSQKRMRQQRKTKSRRQRRTRSQRGGEWYNPFTWFSSEPSYSSFGQEESVVDKVGSTIKSGLDTADSAISSASAVVKEGAEDLVQKTSEILNTDLPVLPSQQSSFSMPSYSTGGKTRARALAKSRARYLARKGGRGVGVAYYASPVDGINVANPTYLENYQGGRRRRTIKRSKK